MNKEFIEPEVTVNDISTEAIMGASLDYDDGQGDLDFGN